MNYDLSIVVPSIRTHNWQRFVDSVKNSCKNHSCEIIFVGPFKTEVVSDIPIRYIHSFDRVGVCLQKGSAEAEGELIYHNVDDSIFPEDTIDIAIDFYKKNCYWYDILNCRYREGKDFKNNEFPLAYWRAGSYPHVYGQSYVNPNWQLSLQPMVNRDFFIMTGGVDCRFEYSNHSHVDFNFRIQQIGGRIIHSPIEIAYTDHGQFDHTPIQLAQEGPDTAEFNVMWNQPREKFIEYDNYKKYEGRWERRFSKEYNSYDELCKGEKYES